MRGLLIGVVLLAVGCASPALDYARARHPGCAVTLLEQRGADVRVRVACPGSDPVEQTYRGR